MNTRSRQQRWGRLLEFLRSSDGPTGVEYAIMLAAIVMVAIAAITRVGGMMAICYENIAGGVASVGF